MTTFTIEASTYISNTEMGAYPETRTMDKFRVKKWMLDVLTRFTANYKEVTEEKLKDYINGLLIDLAQKGVNWDKVIRVRMTPQLTFLPVTVDCIDTLSDHPSIKSSYSCQIRKPFLVITDAGIAITTDSDTK